MTWLKLILNALAFLLGIKKAGRDEQEVADQKGILHDAEVRAQADDAARRESLDSLRKSLERDSPDYPGG